MDTRRNIDLASIVWTSITNPATLLNLNPLDSRMCWGIQQAEHKVSEHCSAKDHFADEHVIVGLIKLLANLWSVQSFRKWLATCKAQAFWILD